jgi:hypothetical protein
LFFFLLFATPAPGKGLSQRGGGLGGSGGGPGGSFTPAPNKLTMKSSLSSIANPGGSSVKARGG